MFSNRGLEKVLQWINDKRRELCYKCSGKKMRVVVDRSFHKWSNTWDDNCNLVGDGSNELLGIATQGVGTEEEEACEEQLMFLTELCDSLSDGGLPRTSGTIEPHNESVRVNLLPDPVHDLAQDGFPGVFVTFRWIAAI